MNTFLRFFYEFISIFFDGIVKIGKGIGSGFWQMFNVKLYKVVIESYKDSLNMFEWFLVGLTITILIAIIISILLLIFFAIRKLIRFGKNRLNQEELLEEIADLNEQVKKLMKEKDELMAMKVSQLGLKPGEEETPEGEEGEELSDVDTTNSRFPKLTMIDNKYSDYKPTKYTSSYTLEELAENFRCFAAKQLKLYYDISLLRTFFAALACGKLIILQGISGTGKTSLAYAWGKFIKNDSCVASVQPSWRDKTEFLGYFNEFTKKFNETEVLAEIYTAGYDDEIHTVILDEMNLARVEYYFAEMLSILEIPQRSEWIIEIVPNTWSDDPKYIDHGKLKLPGNLWYIGTINNDDSTFMVTDKVYDRAMPIDINTKVEPFDCKEQDAVEMNSTYLESLFVEAMEKHKVSKDSLDKLKDMDDYTIAHFRIAFGNRIMKQLHTFVPVYMACGGPEVDAIDYFVTRKIYRKLEQLNIMFIRDEIDPFITYLNKTWGKGAMKELIAYVERLKKS